MAMQTSAAQPVASLQRPIHLRDIFWGTESVDAVREGCSNLVRQIANVKSFGVPVTVSINRFITDTDAELEAVKTSAAVIDIGINQVEMADGSSRVVGDADHDSCRDVAGWLTPVPGGIGPVTVAVLMRNAVTAARLQKQHYETVLCSGAFESAADGCLAAGRRC